MKIILPSAFLFLLLLGFAFWVLFPGDSSPRTSASATETRSSRSPSSATSSLSRTSPAPLSAKNSGLTHRPSSFSSPKPSSSFVSEKAASSSGSRSQGFGGAPFSNGSSSSFQSSGVISSASIQEGDSAPAASSGSSVARAGGSASSSHVPTLDSGTFPLPHSPGGRALNPQGEGQDPVQLPLAFQDPPPDAQWTEEQVSALEDLSEKFVEEIGGPNQDPADPAYRERWVRAQQESDLDFKALFGRQAMIAHELQVMNASATP